MESGGMSYHLNQTKDLLQGATREQIIVNNQWAAVALDKFHKDSKTVFEFEIDGEKFKANLEWDSDFSKAAMKEEVDMAHFGGVAMAWLVMAVIQKYTILEQTEIGDGVDYRFKKEDTDDDDLNFLDDFHYVEISGIFHESKSNTLRKRIKSKHKQIKKGKKRDEDSSVIVTLFSKPITVKEIHK